MTTLAERFRSQRTDRIRVDGFEVFSMTDLVIDGFSALEVVVESVRDDIEQSLTLRSRSQDLRVVDGVTIGAAEPSEMLRIPAGEPCRVEVHGDDATNTIVQMWNSWRIGGIDHAWTGNAGIVVEPLPTPDGASLRKRLWCSDGLGEASFEDLVVLVTLGPRILDS